MPKIIDFTGQSFGLWKVLQKTTKRSNSGCIVYKVINTKDGTIHYKDSWYLVHFKKEKSFKTTPGRKRKWIIIKKPYIEKGPSSKN